MAQKDLPPKFGVAFLPGQPAEFSAWCLKAEGLGFDLVGMPDSQSVYRENIVSSTLVATQTERVRFGPMVTNPVTRHPAVAASAIATLADLAGACQNPATSEIASEMVSFALTMAHASCTTAHCSEARAANSLARLE